ncbi:lactonase family protein [Streptomyces sp. NPDC056405]|uniref:lactonase family protein n=1 Tax=Streptomyces sp. NPDC056405 TaxID=3345811 RepID=UPI0035E3210D
MRDFWIGTYTADAGSGLGIYRAVQEKDGALCVTALTARQESPSYLAVHPYRPVLYAVREGRVGGVFCYELDRGHARLASSTRLPEGACHVAVAPEGDVLVISSYDSGHISSVALDGGGLLSGPAAVVRMDGSGPRADRQEGPHPHAALITPAGAVFSTDLGADKVRIHNLANGGRTLQPVCEVDMPPGCGPRHLVRHPNGLIYVLAELTHTIIALRPFRAASGLDIVAVFPATGVPTAAESLCSAIKISPDGQHIYTATRGADVISTHRVSERDGSLRLVSDVSSGGAWPRDFWTDGTWLYAANEKSHTLASFRINPINGIPSQFAETAVPSPVCIVATRAGSD